MIELHSQISISNFFIYYQWFAKAGVELGLGQTPMNDFFLIVRRAYKKNKEIPDE